MNIEVKTVQYIKQEGISKTIVLPDEKSFYFQTGVRRSVAVIPRWTNWKHKEGKLEEIICWEIICVYLCFECSIEKFSFAPHEVNGIYNQEKGSIKEILDFLIKVDKYDSRTEEQFKQDLNKAFEKYNEILNLEKECKHDWEYSPGNGYECSKCGAEKHTK